MKKIMFSERYGLEQAVLARLKNMTRREIKLPNYITHSDIWNPVMVIDDRGKVYFTFDCTDHLKRDIYPSYQIGEEVWVAQSYRSLGHKPDEWIENVEGGLQPAQELAGYTNKMFVRSLYLMHRIRITNIKAERLQDISEEDAMREGVFKYDKPPLNHESDMFAPWPPYVRPYKHDIDNLIYRCTARNAFAYLIDKVCGGGTWNRNPWVFAYEFELLK
jgi:hypothetical protein